MVESHGGSAAAGQRASTRWSVAADDEPDSAPDSEPSIPARTIALIGAATFGASLAGVVPMGFSLAVRVGEIAPGDETFYGCVIGAGQVVTCISAPLTGVLGGRCRSPLGRRRPFALLGVALAGRYATDSWLLFLVSGVAGGAHIVLFVHEGPVPRGTVVAPLSWSAVARSYLFNPRRYPVFAWAWLGRFMFFPGLSLTSSLTACFYAQRLGMPLAEVARALAVLAAFGVVAAVLGSSASGWVSDRRGTRHGWTAFGGAVFAIGALVSASAHDLSALAVGGVVSALGLAVFGTVGGALTMDVLRERATQAGRYLGVNAFSQQIPAALAPLLAPSLLLVRGDADPDYGLLYVARAARALVGAVIIATKAKASNLDTVGGGDGKEVLR